MRSSDLLNGRKYAALLAGVVVMGSLLATGYGLSRLRSETVDRNLELAALTAQTLEGHLTQSFNVIDRSLANVSEDRASSADLIRTVRQAPYLRSTSVLDPSGEILASSNPRNVGAVVDKAGFMPSSTGPLEVLRVGPVRNGRDFHEAQAVDAMNPQAVVNFIPVMRDVRLVSGNLITVAAAVNSDYFLNFYANHLNVSDGVVQLLRYDGLLLLSTEDADKPGSLGVNAGVVRRVGESEVGRFEETLPGGAQVLTAYRASRVYPYVLVVRLDKARALAAWREETRNTLSIVLGVLLLALASSAWYFVRYEAVARERIRDQDRLRIAAIAFEAQEGMIVTDADSVILQVNKAFTRITGYAAEDAVGHHIRLLKSGQHEPAFYAAMRTSLARADGYAGEILNRHKDGSVHPHYLSITAVRSADGGVSHFVGSLTDITERKRAEDRLRLAASVFSHSREGIMITTADGTIIDVNDAFTRITGHARQDVLGANPRILKSGRQSREHYAAMWRSLIEKGHWYGEVWNRRKNGEVYAQMQTISAVRDAAGVVRQYVALFSDITMAKAHEQQLVHLAHYDALTGLPNRVLLADRLRQALLHAQRHASRLAVVYVDLDGFKAVNDSHGHEAGDQLLVAVASRMKQSLREGDTIARLGGDEFAVVLLDLADLASSVPLLTRLLAAAARPVHVGDLILQVSASLGVSFYPQGDAVEADQLLRQADQAMYQAKLAGKNGFHVFDAEQDRNVRGRHESVERVRQGFARGEMVLHYQPKVNLRTGKVVGVEGLIRWLDPERGLQTPVSFLGAIEDEPLVVEIGEWVIGAALDQLDIWRAAGAVLSVSVNVWPRQIQESGFVERLRRLLQRHPELRPGDLELEILESSALEDLLNVERVIDACRALGVRFVLDDFGTGYSSLTYLKRLKIGQLKIDRSFVHNMLHDPDDLAIIDGVIGLAAAFRLQVVAEGLEEVEHGEMLLKLGCDLAQGFGIAPPMEASAILPWLAAWRPHPSWKAQAPVGREGLPLLFASVDHRAWVASVDSYLRGDRDALPILHRQQCRLGQWLETEALARYAGHPLYGELQRLHGEVHDLAAMLCQSRASGRGADAVARLPELNTLRDALIHQINALLA